MLKNRAIVTAIVVTFLVTAGLIFAAVRLGYVKPSPPADRAVVAPPAAQAPASAPAPAPSDGTPKPGGPLFVQKGVPNVDSRKFSIGPFGAVEFGYVMEKDATLIYEWKSSMPLDFDFHTEPAGKPPEASDSFEADQATEGHGGYVAPYAGIHGWFWQNGGPDEVTLTLTATGFFTKAILYKEDGTTENVPITPPAGFRRPRPKS
jgi:hypothetical protein